MPDLFCTKKMTKDILPFGRMQGAKGILTWVSSHYNMSDFGKNVLCLIFVKTSKIKA